MGWEAWFTLALIVVVLVTLIWNRVSADIVMVGAAALLMLVGILTPSQTFEGMSNTGMITVAVLFVVVAGLQETGAIQWLAHYLLGRPRGGRLTLLRIMSPIAILSAFMNNTPLVAMMAPAIIDWSRRHQLAASRFLIPLSYAAILGGTLTLIGTSTNLVVYGMWVAAGFGELGLFEIAWVGLPCLLVGLAYVTIFGRWLLPDRRPAISLHDDPRSYTVEMIVEPRSPLAGKSIEEAGLRHLPGLFLAELDRGGTILPAVSPREVLAEGDRLVFVGVVESIVDLQKIRGLVPATSQIFKLEGTRGRRCLVEAVVSNTCPLIGMTIRDGNFRTRYNAVVIAVARSGERIRKRIGDIVLKPGDTLLLETRQSFVEQQRNSTDFFLVSTLEKRAAPEHSKAVMALIILLGMVLIATLEPFGFSMLHAAMLAAGLMLFTRCVTGPAARRSVDWSVLIIIAASIALGRAVEITGLADRIAVEAIGVAGGNPWITLIMIYGMTMLLTEMITNNAAAVLMFPLALSAANSLGVDFKPFAFTIMMAASACFSTPIGYQTNLMVMGPGGYRFSDYFRIGIPLNLLMWATTVSIAPRIWPFMPPSP